MLLGFISLLLTVFQGVMQRTCIPPGWTIYMLPCRSAKEQAELSPTEAHGHAAGILGLTRRRLLAEGGPRTQRCQKKVGGRTTHALVGLSDARYNRLCFQSLTRQLGFF
jgi:mlo protein